MNSWSHLRTGLSGAPAGTELPLVHGEHTARSGLRLEPCSRSSCDHRRPRVPASSAYLQLAHTAAGANGATCARGHPGWIGRRLIPSSSLPPPLRPVHRPGCLQAVCVLCLGPQRTPRSGHNPHRTDSKVGGKPAPPVRDWACLSSLPSFVHALLLNPSLLLCGGPVLGCWGERKTLRR